MFKAMAALRFSKFVAGRGYRLKRVILGLVVAWLGFAPAYPQSSPGQTKDKPLQVNAKKAGRVDLETRPRRHTGRALIESAVLITASTIDYWRTYADFEEDWQFALTWKDQKRRFFTAESPKFDSNAFWFNWSHALSGAAYYNLARTNGLNSRASFLFSFGMSALWEAVCEWREIISTNDMIFTSFGGPAVGEPLFQVGSYFSRRRGILNRLAGIIFNPFLAANNWFDRKAGPAADSGRDAAWHRFSLFAGLKSCTVSPAGTTAVPASVDRQREFNLGLEMETATVPGYGRAGAFRGWLAETLSSCVFFDLSFSPDGMEEFNVRTQAVLFGYGWQSIREAPDGSLRGHSASVGLGTAFEVYRKRPVAWYDSSAEIPGGGPALSDARFVRPTPTRFTDKTSAISPLGGVLTFAFFGPRLHARWRTEIYGDFAMVNALAYNRFTESHDTGGVKSTLLNWGYYYALGMTLASDLTVDWRRWRLQGGACFQLYDSVQGQDRYQFLGVVTDDSKIRDTRLVRHFRLGYRLRRTPVELGLAVEGIGRRGRLLDIREHYRETRFYYQLRLVF
jgi:hypothetical protein